MNHKEFCLKYPETVVTDFTDYNEYSKEDVQLMYDTENCIKPSINIHRLTKIESLYNLDKEVFSKYENIIEDYNKTLKNKA